MERIAIMGLGLMGGSLGLALRNAGYSGRVVGYTRNPDRSATALKRGAVDEAFAEPAMAVKNADIVVYCAPILAIPPMVRENLPHVKKGALLTDVGSTKEHLVTDLAPVVAKAGAVFIGSHPIAGSEKQSIDAARPDLYDGATVVVTPTGAEPEDALDRIEQLWRKAKARTVRMSPSEHDQMLARTSHLPHMAAALVVEAVARGGGAGTAAPFCGGGFRDTTRVAEGAPEIWMDILATNHKAIADELRALCGVTEKALRQLETGDLKGLEEMLNSAREARRTLLRGSGRQNASGET